MTDDPTCPCDRFVHPEVIRNPAGLSSILYRVGTFASFREALLRARPGEQNLAHWSPGAEGDLAVQLVEWWAYLADVLTFYNERIANGAYLRTAHLPGAVERIVRVLGYRPRPGIGATATLAARTSSKKPITLPAGFAIQSKPAPGKQPEIFELDAEATAGPGGEADADVVVTTVLTGETDLLLAGTVASLRAGDQVLAIAKDWAEGSASFALLTVASVAPEKSPRGRSNTRVTFTSALPAGATAAGYRLLRSTREARLSPLGSSVPAVIGGHSAHLASLARDVLVGDLVVFQASSAVPTRVTAYAEEVWYANNSSDPTHPPAPPAIPVSVLQTRLSVGAMLDGYASVGAVRVRYGFQDVGEILDDPAAGVIPAGAASVTLVPAGEAPFPVVTSVDVLIEDASDRGVLGRATGGSTSIQVSFSTPPSFQLNPPLRVLFDLLPVSRGKTVSNEVLGSGDPGTPGQRFQLQKAPLTYLASTSPEATDGYRSTLRVLVDGFAWREVPSFYGQPPDARIYVTRQDEKQKTFVVFGDGTNGARLPAGVGNVVASYRTGSGADAPASGSLVTILKPVPGLKGVRNPVAAGGGADPDPPGRLRALAPRSVVTFGRAVSADDYGSIALGAPGVRRARAYFVWDAELQRTAVKLYVGDDDAAIASVKAALKAAADPSRPAIVTLAVANEGHLSLRLLVDPRRDADVLRASVLDNLFAPEIGLFSPEVTRLGEPIHESRIHEACTRVPGVVAVHDLVFSHAGPAPVGPRHFPGEGAYFTFDAAEIAGQHITTEVASHAD
jgi:hypothetical protein